MATYTSQHSGLTIDQAVAFVGSSIAHQYNNSAAYNVGDFVIYNNKLYKCIVKISTSEEWTAAHWTEVLVTDHAADGTVHITDAERTAWNNKVRSYVETEQLILTTN